jgi:uncharacterized protein (TIRG00374 family)
VDVDPGSRSGHLARWHRHGLSRSFAALLAVGVVVALVLRAPSALREFVSAFERMRPARLPLLLVAVVTELVSFVFFARLQARFLRLGGQHLRLRLLVRLSLASSGLRVLLPVGTVVSSGWLYEKYRQFDTPAPVSLFVVFASGFVSTVTILSLLLIGALSAGFGEVPLITAGAGVLAAGSASFVFVVHRLDSLERLIGRRSRGDHRLTARVFAFAEQVALRRVGWRQGMLAFGDAAGNWLADLVCLILAFVLLGQPVPWQGLLFAYSASQVAGGMVPLPGGLGAVEGSMVGALDLLGIPLGQALAAALLYRVIAYWGVAVVGGAEVVAFSRHPPDRADIVEESPTASQGPSLIETPDPDQGPESPEVPLPRA